MRRADRLFQIVQILQRKSAAITADNIANELEVSVRTIYRDIQDLMKNHVPIVGERGTGYLLQGGYDLPPLMFSEEEIDAIMLGAEWVRANGDPEIRRAAEDVLVKIGAVLPKDRQSLLSSMRHVIHRYEAPHVIQVAMPDVRRAIRQHLKAETDYLTLDERATTRILCPLLIVFFENVQLLVAWCELRNDIRHFRMDRFSRFRVTKDSYSTQKFTEMTNRIEKNRTQKTKKNGQ